MTTSTKKRKEITRNWEYCLRVRPWEGPVHFTTFVTESPIAHSQRAPDELARCGFDPCAVTMAPGRAGSEMRIEFRLQLHALAYNLATFLRSTEPPEAMADWSLTRLQLKLIKIGARVVPHTRAITFQLAEVAANVGKQLVDSLGNPPIQNLGEEG